MRRLSSRLTPLYKFGFPGLWVACALYSIFDYFFARQASTLPNNFLPICTLWIFGGALFFWKFGPLKRVYIEDAHLFVSNYIKEVRIPLSEVKEVYEASFWINSPRRIVVILKSSSAFRARIDFAPEFFSTSEVVDELREHLRL